MITENFGKSKFDKTLTIIIEVAAVVGAIVAIGGGWSWYKNNFWQPSVTIKSIDYDNGKAALVINGNNVELLGDTSLSAGGNWAVEFGYTYLDGTPQYNSIVLTQYGNVVKYLDQPTAD